VQAERKAKNKCFYFCLPKRSLSYQKVEKNNDIQNTDFCKVEKSFFCIFVALTTTTIN